MKLNEQPISKKVIATDGHLFVNSIFYTIQGEGPFAGEPAVFIRLAGCNLQCPGCDTNYTNPSLNVTVSSIIDEVIDVKAGAVKLVVITGGEPFRQDIGTLCNTLIILGFDVQIETNGTLPPPNNLHDGVTVVCSPKTGKINSKLIPFIDAYKYVIHADSIYEKDGLPILALNHTAYPRIARPPLNSIKPIYLQPMDSQNEEQNKKNEQAVLKSCMQYGYILQLQIHKLIGVE